MISSLTEKYISLHIKYEIGTYSEKGKKYEMGLACGIKCSILVVRLYKINKCVTTSIVNNYFD